MNVTLARFITTLLRCMMTTALAPMIVATGLLAAPTTCLCGAEMPHEHSLFEVHNHSHGPVNDDRSDERADDAAYDGPVVRAPSPSASLSTAAGSFASETLVVSDGSSTPPIGYDTIFPEHLHPIPDAPPPQA